MIERKYVSVFVAAFVLAAATSGAATVAVLSDSQTVSVQLEPGNVSVSMGENATENVTTNTETVETVSTDDVDGLIVALEPTNGTETDETRLEPEEQTIGTAEQTQYDVVVKGASDGIYSYTLSVKLTDDSVASIEGFEHKYSSEYDNTTIGDDSITISASPEDPPLDGKDEFKLGTVTVNGSSAGQTDLIVEKHAGIVGEPNGSAPLYITTENGSTGLYNISVRRGGALAVNDPPEAANDTYNVSMGGSIGVAEKGGVLANDSDPNGHDLNASVISPPSEGNLTLAADGSFVYNHDGSSGIDTFTYEVRDGHGGTDTATVEIVVPHDNSGNSGGGPPDDRGKN